MAMPGTGCFIATHDIVPGREADYENWHTHEHMIERLTIPGFLRGLRYRSVSDSAPRVCTIYQVESLATLTSPAYMERLNNPTPWTVESVPLGVGMTKTFCNVKASCGHGIGGFLGVIQFTPPSNGVSNLTDWLSDKVLPGLGRQSGLCGAHLLVGDPDASRSKAKERELRSETADVADWIVLIEGYDRQTVGESIVRLTSPDGLASRGAGIAPSSGQLYKLDFFMEEREAKQMT